jgi:hypothetical protein
MHGSVAGDEYGAYVVPGLGPLPYCGLAGVAAVLAQVLAGGDPAHPLCVHLRNGLWLLDYYVGRIDWCVALCALVALVGRGGPLTRVPPHARSAVTSVVVLPARP